MMAKCRVKKFDKHSPTPYIAYRRRVFRGPCLSNVVGELVVIRSTTENPTVIEVFRSDGTLLGTARCRWMPPAKYAAGQLGATKMIDATDPVEEYLKYLQEVSTARRPYVG